jgi:phosphoribosylpyrophosphate synthetase
MASLVARVMELQGIDRVITVDLHAPQIEGYRCADRAPPGRRPRKAA